MAIRSWPLQVTVRASHSMQLDVSTDTLFHHPTLTDFAHALQSAPRHTRALRPRREGPPPLSFAQERVWFLEQLHPSTRAYVAHDRIRFRGPLDITRLKQALASIVRRHAIFRTTFDTVGERPVQTIHTELDVSLPIVDLSGSSSAEQSQRLEQHVAEQLAAPFDLSHLPLVRWSLLRYSATEHVLVQVEHHMLHDAWSIRLFVQQLATIYDQLCRGESPALSAPPESTFADFAASEHTWLESPAADRELRYWQRQLAGTPNALDLPADRPRTALQSFRGGSVRVAIPADLIRDLRSLGRAQEASLFMVLLAAFKALLYRYTGESNLVVGSGFANRPDLSAEAVIGMLVNTVVLRTHVSGDDAFRELLAHVRRTCLGAYANQRLPFDRIVQELRPARDGGRNPLFQIMFSSHETPVEIPAIDGLGIEITEALATAGAKLDLNVLAIPGGTPDADWSVVWEYSTDLFERSTITRMALHYLQVLRSIARDPAELVGELGLLDAAGRELLLEWAQHPRPYPRERSIHSLFAEQAAHSPDALALKYGDSHMTYAELDQRANQLARVLQAAGVRSGDVVGVCLERSPELITSVLSILKAGAAYLPLDPTYPQERLAFMLEDAHARLVITASDLANRLPRTTRCVCLDSDALDAQFSDPVDVDTSADQLVYVMYTSGSTGTPKGVLVTHRGVVRLVKGPIM